MNLHDGLARLKTILLALAWADNSKLFATKGVYLSVDPPKDAATLAARAEIRITGGRPYTQSGALAFWNLELGIFIRGETGPTGEWPITGAHGKRGLDEYVPKVIANTHYLGTRQSSGLTTYIKLLDSIGPFVFQWPNTAFCRLQYEALFTTEDEA